MIAPSRETPRSVLLAFVLLPLCLGCGPGGGAAESQPSYADLVVTYNAELETLDRLEKKRADLIAEYERQRRPDAEKAVQALTDVLNSAAGGTAENDSGEPLDPNAALDRAVASAEKAQQASSQLLETALQASGAGRGDTAPQNEAYPEELERELAALDEEIEKQKARVERARQARDAAEPR